MYMCMCVYSSPPIYLSRFVCIFLIHRPNLHCSPTPPFPRTSSARGNKVRFGSPALLKALPPPLLPSRTPTWRQQRERIRREGSYHLHVTCEMIWCTKVFPLVSVDSSKKRTVSFMKSQSMHYFLCNAISVSKTGESNDLFSFLIMAVLLFIYTHIETLWTPSGTVCDSWRRWWNEATSRWQICLSFS